MDRLCEPLEAIDHGDQDILADPGLQIIEHLEPENFAPPVCSIHSPHVTRNHLRPGGSAIDARTTRHPGYAISQCIRKRIEECFGWGKTIGGLRQTKYRGTAKVDFQFVFTMTAYNLVRLRNLLRPAPA